MGQSVTFTATVTSPAGVPAGSVQFKVDGASFGSPAPLNAGGVASVSTSSLAAGAHVVVQTTGTTSTSHPGTPGTTLVNYFTKSLAGSLGAGMSKCQDRR